MVECARHRKMCVRRGVLSSPSVACTTFPDVCTRILRKKNYMVLKESIAITLSTNFDLAIECLGVSVATIVVKMIRGSLLCSQFFIEWSLPYSLVLRKKGIMSSFFLSKTCENRSSLTIIIIAYQRDGALVPVPLVPGCDVGDVDRRDVVQVSATFFCPSTGLLKISILFVLLPLDHNGVLIVFPCSSSGIHCFPIVPLPWSFAVFLASWVVHSCKVIRNHQSPESGIDPLYCFFIKSKTNAARAEGQSLWYVLQASMALDGSGYLSQLVQLDVAQFMNCAT